MPPQQNDAAQDTSALAAESPDALVSEIDELRDRLSDTIDELVDRVKPQSIARRQLASVKAYFVDPETGVRYEHLVPVVTGTVAAIAGIVVLRRLLK